MNIYNSILEKRKAGKKMLAVLVDPDKSSPADCIKIAGIATNAEVDFFFVGSSILLTESFESCIEVLKRSASIPVVLFPGNTMQISPAADAILFLSLISGRNPDLLIGKHVLSAPLIRQNNLEAISTGYMLIDSGSPTSVSYMSNTFPIPHDKNDIAACTAIAGEMLGMKLIYMDAGSGARFPVAPTMIKDVKKNIDIPLIAGGGIRTAEKAAELCNAGADIIVIGNAIEKDPMIISEIAVTIHALQDN
ncbi:MAG: geranylgeranylglyceryl/heptaprenylglyceryl phosphate synthase [Bacteroidetes bacterium]|nr:geranylgeranylglyceryl/heptaprenylglyceryl phosphate synthase [Bacteroidota bacterium]